jgi:hypothetical protein
MAQFAQQTPDENLSPGWTVQGTGSAQATTGIPGEGYAVSGVVPAATNVGQTSAGFPNPPGAGNIDSENSGSYTSQILVNGSYSVSPTTNLSTTATLPLPTTTGVQQPYGVNTSAAVTGAAVTSVAVAPFTTGTPVYTTVFTGTASANPILVSVPPGGWVKTVGGNATAVVYTPTN